MQKDEVNHAMKQTGNRKEKRRRLYRIQLLQAVRHYSDCKTKGNEKLQNEHC